MSKAIKYDELTDPADKQRLLRSSLFFLTDKGHTELARVDRRIKWDDKRLIVRWKVASVTVDLKTGRFLELSPDVPMWKDNPYIRLEEVSSTNKLFVECFTAASVGVVYQRFWRKEEGAFIVVIDVEEVSP